MNTQRLSSLISRYPRQFWLMFFGMLISTVGTSMIWPFLLVYVGKRVEAPLTVTASLLTLNSAMGLLASFTGGPLIDRLGRKWIMVISLAMNGIAYLFMGSANSIFEYAILLSITGSFNPLYRIGADAMMADLIPPEKRPDAYALLRLSNNLGIAIGPAIGGFLAASTYSLAFYIAALGLCSYSLLLAFFAHETLPIKTQQSQPGQLPVKLQKEKLGGYVSILNDLPYMGFILAFTLVSMCASLVWILLPVFATETYDIPMQLYGLIPTTNAVMVVTLQLFVTRYTKKYSNLPVIAIGASFYTIAVGAVAWMSGFPGFLTCMIIMTMGELIMVPTSSTYVANLAPVDKRGRYMSLYALTWGVASGIAPVFGGFLNDTIGPQAIWYGGALIGMTSVLSFLLLARHEHLHPRQPPVSIIPS
jgi:MFS family permease